MRLSWPVLRFELIMHGTCCMVLAMQVAVALVQSLNVSQGQSAATAAADLAGTLLSTQRRLLNAELRLLMLHTSYRFT